MTAVSENELIDQMLSKPYPSPSFTHGYYTEMHVFTYQVLFLEMTIVIKID